MNKILQITCVVISCLFPSFTHADTHIAESCSAEDVNTAIAAASPGDTVVVPSGSCEWSASGGTNVTVDKAITLQGAGQGITNISLVPNGWTTPALTISAAATITGFSFTRNCSSCYGIYIGGANDWRITNNTLTAGSVSGGHFFSIYGGAYGLIDNNSFIGTSATTEMIFVTGPSDAWEQTNTIGTSSNVFVENNTFSGSGYVSDCNANSHCVFRYNTINGQNKIDIHGKCTNSPARSGRNYEIYNNLWNDNPGGNYAGMEIRGGTGRIFNNSSLHTGANNIYLTLTDYAFKQPNCNGYTGTCCCSPPCDDMIGVGEDPKSRASEPLYLWGNTRNGSEWIPSESSAGNSTCDAEEYCGVDFDPGTMLVDGTDYIESVSKPEAMSAYTPYTCPHPLTGLTGSCDSSIAGVGGYAVGQAGFSFRAPQAGDGSMQRATGGTGSITY